MAPPTKTAAPVPRAPAPAATRAPAAARTPAPPPAPEAAAPSEHIFIESDEVGDPATSARTPGDTVVLRNPIRRLGAELTFFNEGYLKVKKVVKGNADAPFFLDLRFVDPVPKIERVIAMRWLTAAFG